MGANPHNTSPMLLSPVFYFLIGADKGKEARREDHSRLLRCTPSSVWRPAEASQWNPSPLHSSPYSGITPHCLVQHAPPFQLNGCSFSPSSMSAAGRGSKAFVYIFLVWDHMFQSKSADLADHVTPPPPPMHVISCIVI